MAKIKYDEYYEDDEYYGGFQKIKSKGTKKKYKGHQSRRGQSEADVWAGLETTEITLPSTKPQRVEVPMPKPVVQAPSPQIQTPKQPQVENQPKGHVFGPNTHEIKGVKIDMDGISSIEKVENVKNGQKTYGIKFVFKGSKGFSRTIWYNINIRARDAVYNTEFAFWSTLNK